MPIKVLIIEDSENDTLLLLRELKHLEQEVVYERIETAEGMKAALDRQKWDVVISDYIMPRFNGLAALEILKNYGIDIPFIMVSGKVGEEIAVDAMKAGAHDYIVKGNLSRLVPAVERELGDAETRRWRRQAEEELRRHRDHLEELVEERTAELLKTNEHLQQEIKDRILAEEALWKAIRKVEDEKAKSEAIIAALGDGLVIVDTDFHILYQNKIHTDILGEHVGSHCYAAYFNSIHICDECPIAASFKDGKIHRAEIPVRTGGGVLDLEVIASPLRDGMGNIIAGIEVVRDITDRKNMENELRSHRDHLDTLVQERTAELIKVNKELRAEIMRRIQMEKELIESQRFVQNITDTTPNLLYLHDISENRNIYVNPIVRDILGYTPEEIKRKGTPFLQSVLHPDDFALMRLMPERFARAGDGEIIESECRLRNSKGEWRWFNSRNIVFKRTDDRVPKLILGIAQDITEKKNADEELKSSQEQLRKLLAHLQTVREDERTKISREIHDELGQSLTALKMDVVWMAKRLNKDQGELNEKAKMMSKLIDLNIQTVKRISAELRPGLLDNLGLAAALEWQTEEFQGSSGISCEIVIKPEDITVKRDIATAIFRVFQEILTNVIRHSGATKVRASLKSKDGKLVLQVRDNGKGITKKQLMSPKSIGLIGMRERINFLDGKVDIAGVQDKGTTVTISIPFEGEE